MDALGRPRRSGNIIVARTVYLRIIDLGVPIKNPLKRYI